MRNSSFNVPRPSFIDRLRGKGPGLRRAPTGSPAAVRVHSDDTPTRMQALSVRSVDGGKRSKSSKSSQSSTLSASLGAAGLSDLTSLSQIRTSHGNPPKQQVPLISVESAQPRDVFPKADHGGTLQVPHTQRGEPAAVVPPDAEGRAGEGSSAHGGVERASSSPAKARSQLLTRLTSIDDTSMV